MISRKIRILALAAALAPGLWLRADVPSTQFMPPLALRAVDIERGVSGPFTLLRAWQLLPRDPYAGGYSALLWRGGDRLLAASDNGRLIELEGPDFDRGLQRPGFVRNVYDKVSGDIEALAGMADGRVWAAAEGRNAISRANAELAFDGDAKPRAMAGWRYNSGPESFTRLPDGRFLAVAERGGGGRHAGVLFAGDPVADDRSESFTLRVPAGFRPVDAVAAPDGMLLVLLRRVDWALPPDFASAIARYDLSALAPGATWEPVDWFALPDTAPRDNYEGLALRPEPGGGAKLWLISDDNLSGFQRSLLLEMGYAPDSKKARGSPARPSRD